MSAPQSAPVSVLKTETAIRPAQLRDIAALGELLSPFVASGVLLPRDETNLTRNLREFFLLEWRGEIAACAALQIFTRELGEVRSLAVAPQFARRGFGRQLVAHVESEAAALGLSRLIALTVEAEFFHKLGYRTVDMRDLPEKLWGVCINCPKFRNCDEIAVQKDLQ